MSDCNKNTENVTHVEIRMYRMGTGDCFVLKFFRHEEVTFKMMIDAGAASGGKEHFSKFIVNLKDYVDNHIDVLVITHEHQDHVLAFERCKDLFIEESADNKKLEVDQIWMGWTEEDGNPKVEQWKKEYGQAKFALKKASHRLRQLIKDPGFKDAFTGARYSDQLFSARVQFSESIQDFSDLHINSYQSLGVKEYKGLLKGMKVVKEDIAKDNMQYFYPGEVLKNITGLEGINIYVLGPPKLYEGIEIEHGGKQESYDKNFGINGFNALSDVLLNLEEGDFIPQSVMPFEKTFLASENSPEANSIKKVYRSNEWQKIDHDWMYEVGALALRLNEYTNNLSLVLAFEFQDSGRIILFPGDAEYGSWASWHQISWNETDKDGKAVKTEDLLNKTVFYKVAHHLSHNGTAKRLGLQMMKHPDLTAMATLDYDRIGSSWKNTMPNAQITEELLEKTKGRLIVMNEDGMTLGDKKLEDAIQSARSKMTSSEKKQFEDDLEKNDLYFQFVVRG